MNFYFTLPKFQVSHVTGLQKLSLMFLYFHFNLPKFSSVTCHRPRETKSDVLAFSFYLSQSLMFMNFYFTLPKFQVSHVTGLQKLSLMFNFYFTFPKFSSVTCHRPPETKSDAPTVEFYLSQIFKCHMSQASRN